MGPGGKNPASFEITRSLRRFFLNEQLVKCFLILILIGHYSLYYPLIGPYLQSAALAAPSYCSIEKPDMAWARGTWCGVRPSGEKQAKGERSLPRPQATTRVSASQPGQNAEFLHDSRLGTKQQSPLYASLSQATSKIKVVMGSVFVVI